MAVLFRSQRPHLASDRPAVPPFAIPDSYLHRHDAEAPDRGGEQRREAPEARLLERSEAPDAGDGRMGVLEQEFTHGRSQS